MIPVMVVPVLNRYDLLQRMLDSIDYPVRDLLIIDNGNGLEDVTVPWRVADAHILRLPANLGVSGSWNFGIKMFPHAEKWLFASNDVVFGRGALETLSEARGDEIVLSDVFPFWHTFSVGDEAVSRLGLFDECGFFPAYYEDNDYQRRADYHGVTVRKLAFPVTHDNSSTIRSDESFNQANSQTFARNKKHFDNKVRMDDFTPGEYSLQRRRVNDWSVPR